MSSKKRKRRLTSGSTFDAKPKDKGMPLLSILLIACGILAFVAHIVVKADARTEIVSYDLDIPPCVAEHEKARCDELKMIEPLPCNIESDSDCARAFIAHEN
jgi:hypothetical protein